jgi:predicted oxidoreductase
MFEGFEVVGGGLALGGCIFHGRFLGRARSESK